MNIEQIDSKLYGTIYDIEYVSFLIHNNEFDVLTRLIEKTKETK